MTGTFEIIYLLFGSRGPISFRRLSAAEHSEFKKWFFVGDEQHDSVAFAGGDL